MSPEQTHAHKSDRPAETAEVQEFPHNDISTGSNTVDGQKLKDEMDDLLDEIDEVLEVNAIDFVKGFVQRGGQ